MKLEPLSEIVGVVTDIQTSKNRINVTFSLTRVIEIPEDAIQQKQLLQLIGKRVGLFNFNGNYKIRIVKTCTKEK